MGTDEGRKWSNQKVLAGRIRGATAWVLTAAVLGVVLTMIGIGATRVGSPGATDVRAATDPSLPVPSPSPAEGSDARVLDLRTGDVSWLPHAIAGVPRDCCYSVSPDGERIAFVGMVGDADDSWSETFGILVADVDGSDVRQVATDVGPEPIGAPQWSPDGTEIVYRRESDLAIVVVDVATGVVTPITAGGIGKYGQPTFSPDGATILFTRDDALWTMPATGGRESSLLRPGAYGTYSPDGTTIAYTSVWGGGSDGTYRGIWLAAADGSHPRPEPSGWSGSWYMGLFVGRQERSRAAWSPDGTRIAASFADGSPVVVVDLRTNESQKVAERGLPTWLDDHTVIIDHYLRDGAK